MVSFGLKYNDTEKVFTRKGLVTSTMGAMMKTTTSSVENCGILEFQNDLLEECGIDHDNPFAEKKCDGKTSCEFLKERMSQILEKTLGFQNKQYHLTVDTLTGTSEVKERIFEIKDKKEKGCPLKAGDKEEETYFVPTLAGQVKTTLMLC